MGRGRGEARPRPDRTHAPEVSPPATAHVLAEPHTDRTVPIRRRLLSPAYVRVCVPPAPGMQRASALTIDDAKRRRMMDGPALCVHVAGRHGPPASSNSHTHDPTCHPCALFGYLPTCCVADGMSMRWQMVLTRKEIEFFLEGVRFRACEAYLALLCYYFDVKNTAFDAYCKSA